MENEQWNSCCLKMDRQAVVFFSQLSVSIGIIVFCMTRLVYSESCERDTLYSSTMLFVTGLVLPNPSFHTFVKNNHHNNINADI